MRYFEPWNYANVIPTPLVPNLVMISVVRNVFTSLRYRMRPITDLPYRGTGRPGKRVLLSYLTRPFRDRTEDHVHPNRAEARVIASLFMDRGYRVSVVHYLAGVPLDYSKYDVIFGMGNPLENSFQTNFKGTRIFYATTASADFHLAAEASRLQQLKKRRGILLQPRRTINYGWACSQSLSDAIVCLGNKWTISTLQPWSKRVYRVPVSCIRSWRPNELDSEQPGRRRGFLWLGGRGAVHKGLDLVLEALDFQGVECRLFVCGPIEDEIDFIKAYKHQLEENSRVSFEGFVDIRTEKFRSIAQQCAYVILPSCSEGGGSSVLTAMSMGLIPVVTTEAAIDAGNSGLLINDATPAGVASAMNRAMELSEEDYRARSESAVAIGSGHSIDNFENAFSAALDSILPN